MSKQLKLGIIGISEGNGHPYSWAAIFNAYNPEIMKTCPYPVIFERSFCANSGQNLKKMK